MDDNGKTVGDVHFDYLQKGVLLRYCKFPLHAGVEASAVCAHLPVACSFALSCSFLTSHLYLLYYIIHIKVFVST